MADRSRVNGSAKVLNNDQIPLRYPAREAGLRPASSSLAGCRPAGKRSATRFELSRRRDSSYLSATGRNPGLHHRGGALRRPRIVNDWKRSFVAASVLDFALLITCLLVTDADDKLFMVALCNRADHYIFAL